MSAPTRRRRFGQHFLRDRAVVARIVAAVDPAPTDRCVEIGPGRGALTGSLLEAAGSLDVVEIDRDLARGLESRFADAPGLRVHAGDALEFDFAGLADGPGRLRVIGNLPYNVATPILFRLFAQAAAIRDAHVMLQREVVERIVAPPGGASYGRLTVMTRLHCRAERLFSVPPEAFSPPPRVWSAVIRLVLHRGGHPAVADPGCFEQVVRRAFSQRRKTLRNSLRGLLSAEEIARAGIDPSARPETVDFGGFAALAGAVAAAAGDGPALPP